MCNLDTSTLNLFCKIFSIISQFCFIFFLTSCLCLCVSPLHRIDSEYTESLKTTKKKKKKCPLDLDFVHGLPVHVYQRLKRLLPASRKKQQQGSCDKTTVYSMLEYATPVGILILNEKKKKKKSPDFGFSYPCLLYHLFLVYCAQGNT